MRRRNWCQRQVIYKIIRGHYAKKKYERVDKYVANGARATDGLKKIVTESRKLLKGVDWGDDIYNSETVK